MDKKIAEIVCGICHFQSKCSVKPFPKKCHKICSILALIEQEQKAKCDLCEQLDKGLDELMVDKIKRLQKEREPMVEALKGCKDEAVNLIICNIPSQVVTTANKIASIVDAVLLKGEGK